MFICSNATQIRIICFTIFQQAQTIMGGRVVKPRELKMRKVLAFAAIVALVLAISSVADARGGGRGHGGGGFFGGGKTFSVGKAFHGGRTFHSGRTFRGGKKTVYGGKTLHGGKTVHGSKKTVDGGKTVRGGNKTVDGGKTNGSGKTAAGSTTTAGSKTTAGSNTTDGTKTADGSRTADGGNKECTPSDYAGLTPGQAMRLCGPGPDGHGASYYAHLPKTNGRLNPPPTTDQTNTNQTNNYASPDTGTGLVSDGAYRDPNTGQTTYSYHDPRTGLTYYRTDAQTVQPSSGATYRTPTTRLLDTLGSFYR
jgi:hypothetical protein